MANYYQLRDMVEVLMGPSMIASCLPRAIGPLDCSTHSLLHTMFCMYDVVDISYNPTNSSP